MHGNKGKSEYGAINWERFRDNWAQLIGPVKERWKKLSKQRLEEIDGARDELLDELQQVYGLQREEAEAQLDAFIEENEEYFDLVRDSSASTPLSPRP